MTETAASPGPEIVGLVDTRERFDDAVKALTAAGFQRTDLSVLTSRDSIDVAGKPGNSWRDAMTAVVGDIKYEGPLVASGAVFLIGGPFAAAVAAVVGAAVGGMAIGEVLEEVTSAPDTAEFARAVEAGSIILWVRTPDPEAQERAIAALTTSGATNIHLHGAA
ncbi:MAG: hypothetical protein ACPGO3_12175 [Magnetospiraceae bacterium]